MNERECCIALNMVAGLTSLRCAQLLTRLGSARAIVDSSETALQAAGVYDPKLRQDILQVGSGAGLRAELEQVRSERIRIITRSDEDYPVLLAQIYDPPLVLYVRGSPAILQKTPAVAVVGCRRASWYGLQQAERMGASLARRGAVVVSGLARGIDSAAHKGALSAAGFTVAVLGSGLHCMYPRENERLARDITKNGAVISEFPLQTKPLPQNFPRRNRIVSGLSRAVVVVEAAQRSGSLITADLALEQGREVVAVPGPVSAPTAVGTHKLIKEGARLVENGEDVMQDWPEIRCSGQHSEYDQAPVGLDQADSALLAMLHEKPIHIDEIMRRCNAAAAGVYQRLLELQLRGLVKEVAGKRFVRVRNRIGG